MTLEYFLEACQVAVAVVVILESRPYEMFVEFLDDRFNSMYPFSYCALCIGFWMGAVYFSLHYYFGYYKEIPILRGAFMVSALAYTLKGFWIRLWDGQHDN